MNYYPRHIGDYAKDTGHLSMLEHGAYTLLLDRYYATESGIPDDQKYRLARARTKEEKEAVDVVLGEFFTLDDGIWKKPRCEAEIAKAQKKIAAAVTNGANGGRPRKNPEETQQKPTGLFLGSDSESQSKALQSPISNLQSPHTNSERERDTEQAIEDSRRCVDLAVPLREAGVKVSSMHPTLVAWVKDGFTLQHCLSAVAVARESKPDGLIAANYLDPIIREPRKPKLSVVQQPVRQHREFPS